MSEKKRDLMILTDDPKRIRDEYLKYFKRAGVADIAVVENITNFNSSVIKLIDDSKSTVMMITDVDDYTDDLFMNSALIHIIENQDIDFLVVDSVTGWRNVEFTFDETNKTGERQKKWTQFENLFNFSELELLISCLQEMMVPENIVYAFISDNDSYIDKLFDNLLEKIKDSGDKDGDGDDGPIDSKKKLHLDHFLPKIFMGWIWRVWYGPDRVSSKNADKDTKNEPDIDNESYVRRSVILKLDDYTITYIHIHPNINLDLSEILEYFDKIYIDLNTHYSSLVFRKPEDKYFKVNFELFLEGTTDSDCDYDTSDWLNIVKNYVDITKLIINKGFDGLYMHNIWETEHKPDKKTRTVYTTEGYTALPAISLIETILPPDYNYDHWCKYDEPKEWIYDSIEEGMAVTMYHVLNKLTDKDYNDDTPMGGFHNDD